MPQYWWVNHKQTARQEIEGQYLWSPKTKANRARSVFYDNMRLAAPGDLVLSFANQEIRSIGRIAEFAFTAPKPAEFGSTGDYWGDEDWYLPVFWTRLDSPVRPKDMIDALRPFLPKKYSPIRPRDGNGNQGVYLANISKAVFDAIVATVAMDRELLARGGTNSLTYQAITEQLDDRAEQIVRRDTGLDKTTREAVIQARRGQGKFRSNVEAIEKSCRLTGISNPLLLIASHIKPWRSYTSAQERLDGMNGLLLTPDADLLFDRGFMTFEDGGQIKVSSRIDRDDLRRLGFGELIWDQYRGFAEAPMTWQTQAFAPAQCKYLKYHRSDVYVG